MVCDYTSGIEAERSSDHDADQPMDGFDRDFGSASVEGIVTVGEEPQDDPDESDDEDLQDHRQTRNHGRADDLARPGHNQDPQLGQGGAESDDATIVTTDDGAENEDLNSSNATRDEEVGPGETSTPKPEESGLRKATPTPGPGLFDAHLPDLLVPGTREWVLEPGTPQSARHEHVSRALRVEGSGGSLSNMVRTWAEAALGPPAARPGQLQELILSYLEPLTDAHATAIGDILRKSDRTCHRKLRRFLAMSLLMAIQAEGGATPFGELVAGERRGRATAPRALDWSAGHPFRFPRAEH
jgi:hypothetical protein